MNCRRLKDQLDTLERETTDKLGQMEQYNKELKVSAEQMQGAEKFRLSHVSSLQRCGDGRKAVKYVNFINAPSFRPF